VTVPSIDPDATFRPRALKHFHNANTVGGSVVTTATSAITASAFITFMIERAEERVSSVVGQMPKESRTRMLPLSSRSGAGSYVSVYQVR